MTDKEDGGGKKNSLVRQLGDIKNQDRQQAHSCE